jgi:hypothetical protein
MMPLGAPQPGQDAIGAQLPRKHVLRIGEKTLSETGLRDGLMSRQLSSSEVVKAMNWLVERIKMKPPERLKVLFILWHSACYHLP